MSETLDVNEAAALMKVHPKTVLDYIDKKKLRAGRIGRAYVMLRRDVMDLIERIITEQMNESDPQPRPKRQRRAAAATT